MESEAGRTTGIINYILGLLGQQTRRGLETIVRSAAIVFVVMVTLVSLLPEESFPSTRALGKHVIEG